MYPASDASMSQMMVEESRLKRKRADDELLEQEWPTTTITTTKRLKAVQYVYPPSLFMMNDIMHHIIAQLFYKPTYFVSIDGDALFMSKDYIHSQRNNLALRDVCRLLQTCRYMYNVLGKEILPLMPNRKPDECVTCHKKSMVPCNTCKVVYCYGCDAHDYPKTHCDHCNTLNVCCPCIETKYKRMRKRSKMTIKCHFCHHKLHLSSFFIKK